MFKKINFFSWLFKYRILSLLCLIFFLLFCACDQMEGPDPSEWQSFGLDGVRVFELTQSDNFLYAAVGKDGLYRRDLSKETSQWKYLGLAEPNVNFGIRTFYRDSDTGTMYAGFFEHNWDGPGLFRSIDDGQSWEPFVAGIEEQFEGQSAFVTKLAAPKDRPSEIFAGTSSALFKLTQDNSGWEFLNESAEFGKGVLSMSFNPLNTQEIWAGGRSGFDTAKLLNSTDNGKNWIDTTTSLGETTNITTNEVRKTSIHPNQPDVIYLTLIYEVLKSENGGESWHKLESDLNEEGLEERSNENVFSFFNDLSINPNNPNEILAAGKFLYQSQDAGDTWEVVSDTTRSGILDIQVDWDNRVVYGSIFNPEKGVFTVKI